MKKYGYPVISKEVARDVSSARNKPDGKTMQKFVRNSEYHKKYGDSWLLEKYAYLLNAPFKISNQCCNVMKKKPMHEFGKESGKVAIVGTMACESALRKNDYLKTGCNAFNKKHPQSQPMGFWTEQDVLEYLHTKKIPYASIYGDIVFEDGKYHTTGVKRSGCILCGFGCHLEKEPNRFQMLKETHPKLWNYCMKPIEDGGLGLRHVMEYIGVKVE